jgi:hypothetical protein
MGRPGISKSQVAWLMAGEDCSEKEWRHKNNVMSS